jgi:hypothetical protein
MVHDPEAAPGGLRVGIAVHGQRHLHPEPVRCAKHAESVSRDLVYADLGC